MKEARHVDAEGPDRVSPAAGVGPAAGAAHQLLTRVLRRAWLDASAEAFVDPSVSLASTIPPDIADRLEHALDVMRPMTTDCPHHCEEGHYSGDDMAMAEIATGWPARWEEALAERDAARAESERLREALDRLAWCAVRYGLGRRTYVTADIAETVARVKGSLRDDTLRIIVTDIDRAEGRGPDGLGDAVDAGVWRGLRAALGDRP